MKKRTLAWVLTLGLLVGLLTLPAQALTFSDADIYLKKVKSIKGASYLVDFDGDGREELVFTTEEYGSKVIEIWQGNRKLGSMTDYYAGTMGDDDVYFARRGGKVYLVHHSYMYRDDYDEYSFYTVENGKWVEKSNLSAKGSNYDKYTWEDMEYTAGEHSVVSQLKKAATPVAPPLPTVPAAPLGSGPKAAKAEAIEALEDISYYGDRSAIAMTQAQVGAILNQISYYAASAPTISYSDPGTPTVYAALFDTGSGVPGLFLAKGYSVMGEGATVTRDGSALYDMGESAFYTFQNGKLTLFSPAAYGDNNTLYPACVCRSGGAPDGSYWESRYYPMNYGTLSNAPATTIIESDDGMGNDSYTVNGSVVNEDQAEEFHEVWQGSGQRAYAAPGGGVEYVIKGMTPAEQMTEALWDYVHALNTPYAHPSNQPVQIDDRGEKTQFAMYALEDEAGNQTNYIRIRDLAAVLASTGAKFSVDWDNVVILRKGEDYVPGSAAASDFTGSQTYTVPTETTLVDGEELKLDAIRLTDANGGGHTYYQLRDLGKALGFNVGWSAERGVYIETDKPYELAD